MVARRLSASHKTDYDCWLEFFVAHWALWFAKALNIAHWFIIIFRDYKKSKHYFWPSRVKTCKDIRLLNMWVYCSCAFVFTAHCKDECCTLHYFVCKVLKCWEKIWTYQQELVQEIATRHPKRQKYWRIINLYKVFLLFFFKFRLTFGNVDISSN